MFEGVWGGGMGGGWGVAFNELSHRTSLIPFKLTTHEHNVPFNFHFNDCRLQLERLDIAHVMSETMDRNRSSKKLKCTCFCINNQCNNDNALYPSLWSEPVLDRSASITSPKYFITYAQESASSSTSSLSPLCFGKSPLKCNTLQVLSL